MTIPCDSHVHTPLCGHASGDPVEYVRAAAERGITILGFACHCPMTSDEFGGPRIRMGFDQIGEYRRIVRDAADLGQTLGVEVLCGIEAEYFPEPTELVAMDAMLAREPFDFVLGSVHPHLAIYKRWFAEHGIDNDAQRQRVFWRHLAEAARCGRYDAITHPDVVRCHGTIEHYDPHAHEDDIAAFCDALDEAGLCMEINTSGLFRPFGMVHPHPLILRHAAERQLPLVIGSDAHQPDRVGSGYDQVEPLLIEHGWSSMHVFRRRRHYPVKVKNDPTYPQESEHAQ